MKLEFSGQIFEKSSNTRFRKNPSILRDELSHVYGHTDGNMKLIVAFRNFASEPNFLYSFLQCLLINNSKSPFLISLDPAVALSFPSPKDSC